MARAKTNIDTFRETMQREKPKCCIVPFMHALVDANGEVFSCCRLANDNGNFKRNDKIVLGKLGGDTSIRKIWYSDRALKIRKKLWHAKEPECSQCDRYNDINRNFWEYHKVEGPYNEKHERIFL
jgi:radical SAM protein with 4Fe4S-binding SPASM domain